MAIQELSKVEVEVVSGGLVLLGLDLGAVLGALLTPVLGIVTTALTIVDSTVVAAGGLLGNVLASVNNVIVGLGL
jgi:hypothetical protein